LLIAAAMDELDEVARTEIRERWDVLDADGEHIGQVGQVHGSSFTLESSIGRRLEIDFRDVESADDGTVSLMVSGEELTSNLED
jgi:hypothetical protein